METLVDALLPAGAPVRCLFPLPRVCVCVCVRHRRAGGRTVGGEEQSTECSEKQGGGVSSHTAAAAVAVATLVIGTTVFFSLPIMIPFLCNTDLIPFASFGFPTWHICLLIGRRAMIRCAVVCRSIKSVFFTRPIRHRPDLYLPPVNHSCRSISWKTKFSGVCRLTFR